MINTVAAIENMPKISCITSFSLNKVPFREIKIRGFELKVVITNKICSHKKFLTTKWNSFPWNKNSWSWNNIRGHRIKFAPTCKKQEAYGPYHSTESTFN
jgi:hypothetical protein